MTARRKKRHWQDYGFLVMILLVATETAILGSLQISSGTPVLLWISNPGVLMTMLLGSVITLLFRAYGEPDQSLWAGLITSALALAAAIAVLSKDALR